MSEEIVPVVPVSEIPASEEVVEQDVVAMTQETGRRIRLLAERNSGGVRISLRWHTAEDALDVLVEDPQTDERYEIATPKDRGLEVFYHPYAYLGSTALAAA